MWCPLVGEDEAEKGVGGAPVSESCVAAPVRPAAGAADDPGGDEMSVSHDNAELPYDGWNHGSGD